jgi:hypothetical protein
MVGSSLFVTTNSLRLAQLANEDAARPPSPANGLSEVPVTEFTT